jgi:hypothetical protein
LLRALAARPQILALDEALGAIDTPSRDGILDRLRAWAEAVPDRLLILTSHEFGDIARIADRILVLKDGRILRDGTPASLKRAPGSWEVAALVGFVARIRVGQDLLALPPDGVGIEPPGVPYRVDAAVPNTLGWTVRLPVLDGRERFILPAAPRAAGANSHVVYLRGVRLDSAGDPSHGV